MFFNNDYSILEALICY